jgi:DNA-binding CsgD family transcriptional regulator
MREVASLVACGLGDRDVAAALTLEWRTVKSYLWHVYSRLGVRTRTQLAIVAIATGEVEVDQALQLWRRYAPEACGPDRQFQGETRR